MSIIILNNLSGIPPFLVWKYPSWLDAFDGKGGENCIQNLGKNFRVRKCVNLEIFQLNSKNKLIVEMMKK